MTWSRSRARWRCGCRARRCRSKSDDQPDRSIPERLFLLKRPHSADILPSNENKGPGEFCNRSLEGFAVSDAMHRLIRACAMLLAPALAFSQSQTGSLSGTVLDANDAAIAAAVVEARETNTGVTARTVSSDAGVYVFPSLPTGTWTISAEKPGFKKLVRSGI